MGYKVEHFIKGKRTHDKEDQPHALLNPATNEHQGEVYYASPNSIELALASAKEAFATWSQTTLAKRSQILFKYKTLIEQNQNELAALITQEHGKTLADSIGSIQRGLSVVEYACGIASHLKGDFAIDASTGIDCYSLRQPLGVCVGITPFNFPAMIPLWMFPLSIACGNTFILKPSEKDPSCGLRLAELMHEAGLPDGVLNVLQGGREVVDALLHHPDIKAVSFVGSSPIAEYVYKTATSHHKRVQAFGGAKNHCIVMPDADLQDSVNSIMGAAYGSAGERCMAISVVLAVGDEVADALITRLKEKISHLSIGPGTSDVDIGPLVTQEHLQKVTSYIDLGIEEGAELVVDGRDTHKNQSGNFLGASLFDRVQPSMRIYQEEIFGPVLSVVRVPDFSTAIELTNSHQFGNGTAIFTRDPNVARTFAKEAQVGMIGINIPIPVPVAQFSFGGWKRSLFGDLHMHGQEGIQFYTKLKTITSKWPISKSGIAEYKMPTLD
ncbi:MAG: CoA-acylating methylmalonate-semialdehyde dehydrogenase [Gammaproteobacteria bacterium]|nr:CoA-acylating methylmalonate-semialdehyde dehydrogenase [Gammaproteobacteria bacterium]